MPNQKPRAVILIINIPRLAAHAGPLGTAAASHNRLVLETSGCLHAVTPPLDRPLWLIMRCASRTYGPLGKSDKNNFHFEEGEFFLCN